MSKSDTNECFTVVSGLDIKKSLGIVRGKNDKVDAKRIANYAWEKRDKITLSEKTPDDFEDSDPLFPVNQYLPSNHGSAPRS